MKKRSFEKIDIGGPSMIRGAGKNHKDVVVVANKADYPLLEKVIREQRGETTLEQRRMFAIKAFDVCTAYDTAISNYFHQLSVTTPLIKKKNQCVMERTHTRKLHSLATLNELFDQLNGKELSYNNLVDVDAAVQLIKEFTDTYVCDHQTHQCLAVAQSTT
jgi:phosphoribosylaminoimidazolecarboxamide formyltransferase/IMP cyclohydrolase